jgi:ribose transport system substrate-binding protein
MQTRWAAIALCLLTLTGCDSKSGPATTRPVEKVTIAVIPKGTSHVFWQSVHAGANRAARELNIADPVWIGPTQESDRGQQIQIVDDMLARRDVAAMVLAPLDQDALRPSVEQVFARMPIVIFDSAIKGTQDYTAFVATDNYRGGYMAGEHLLKLLGSEAKGSVALVRVAAGSASTTEREQGFLDAIGLNRGITVIDAGYSDSDREKARVKAADLLVGPKGKGLLGMFGPNESSAMGILMALRERKLEGKVRLVCFDTSSELAAALDEGTVDALVLQNPVQMGYRSVMAAYAAIKKKPVEKDQKIEPTLITPQNKNQPAMQELLRPRLEADLAPRK